MGREVRGSFARARMPGTGILLLKREVLARMRGAYPDLWVEQISEERRTCFAHPTTGLFQPFSGLRDDDGIEVGEDVAFCRRWIDGCGGEMWVCIDERITHTGRTVYAGNYLERLKVEFAEKQLRQA
jgi:hypothetical protein